MELDLEDGSVWVNRMYFFSWRNGIPGGSQWNDAREGLLQSCGIFPVKTRSKKSMICTAQEDYHSLTVFLGTRMDCRPIFYGGGIKTNNGTELRLIVHVEFGQLSFLK